MTEYILPVVYTSDTSYMFKMEAIPFVKVEEIDLIEQKLEKLPKDWQSVAKMLIENARQFPIIEKNINARNYSQPSVYEKWYCTVQNIPMGNHNGQLSTRTRHKFLSDPTQWNLDLVRQICLYEETVKNICQLVGVYVNLTCLKRTRMLDDDLESGAIIVRPITPLEMAKSEVFAIYNVDTGGYFKKSQEGVSSEPLSSATLFPSEVLAQQALDKTVDYGYRYTIVPITMQAHNSLDIVNKGARQKLTEHQQSLLAELNRQVLVNQAGITEKLEKKSSAKAKKM